MITKKTIKSKIALPLTLGLLIASSLAPVAAHAATTSNLPNITPTTSVSIVGVNQTQLNNIITKGNAAIEERLATLNNLLSVVRSTTNKLSPTDRANLIVEIDSEIAGLTTLKTQLDGETTVTAAQTDNRNIYLDFRVYGLVVPKVTMVKAADDQQATEDLLSAMSIKLQYRINNALAAGQNVTALQDSLNTMESDTTTAQANSSAVETTVLPLLPAQYNTNPSLLDGDYAQLKLARQDNNAAYALAQEIVTGLKAL